MIGSLNSVWLNAEATISLSEIQVETELVWKCITLLAEKCFTDTAYVAYANVEHV